MEKMDSKKYGKKSILSLLAKILSIVSISVLLLFYIGEGFNPFHLSLKELVLQFFFPLGVVVGMVSAWRYEIPGGIISIVSLLCFYLIHYFTAGYFPKGLAFMMFALPGVLFLINGVLTIIIRKKEFKYGRL